MSLVQNLRLGILVDQCDIHLLELYTFSIDAYGYAVCWRNGKIAKLHRLILITDLTVDHINGNKLDNKRSNLRAATIAQNVRNRPKQLNNTTGYKGVTKTKYGYSARICVDYTRKTIGTYDTKEQAALMYDIEAKKQFGSFAQLNFNLELT